MIFKMQGSRLKPIFSLASVSKNFVRAVAVDTATAKNGNQKLKSYKEIPGPSSLPIIGQLHHFIPGGELDTNLGLQFGTEVYRRYGPIVKFEGFLGRPDFILLYDAESCAHLLRSENWLPIRPGFQSLDYYRRTLRRKTNQEATFGLLTDHGETWKQFRSTVNPVLLQPKTIKLYNNMLDEVARDMITRLKSIRAADNTIKTNFELEMNLWSLESIGLVALGRRLNCFDPNLPADSPAKRLIKCVHDIFMVANDLDFKPSLWRYIPTKKYRQAMKVYEEQDVIAKHFIDQAIEELETQGKRKTEDEKGILEKLLEINKEMALIMASDMLFAGVDTTSNTITATLYLLANNQEKQDKLRQELLSQPDHNEKRPYLKACLKESLRMMPIVSGNARETTKDYNILGYLIPKKTQVSLMHQAMSMMEEHYPKPNEYLPERWLATKGEPLYHGNAHPFAHSPFGFGVRSCIGRRIAELEMEMFLARLIENFKVEWFGPPMKVVPSTLNYITGPFNFVFKDV